MTDSYGHNLHHWTQSLTIIQAMPLTKPLAINLVLDLLMVPSDLNSVMDGPKSMLRKAVNVWFIMAKTEKPFHII